MSVTRRTKELRLQLWFSKAAIYLVVVTLALLNPLACIIHCAVKALPAHGQHHAIATTDFLCDLTMDIVAGRIDATGSYTLQMQTTHREDLHNTSTHTTTELVPHAVYESLPLALVAMLILAIVYPLTQHSLGLVRSRSDSPPSPPPRFA